MPTELELEADEARQKRALMERYRGGAPIPKPGTVGQIVEKPTLLLHDQAHHCCGNSVNMDYTQLQNPLDYTKPMAVPDVWEHWDPKKIQGAS